MSASRSPSAVTTIDSALHTAHLLAGFLYGSWVCSHLGGWNVAAHIITSGEHPRSQVGPSPVSEPGVPHDGQMNWPSVERGQRSHLPFEAHVVLSRKAMIDSSGAVKRMSLASSKSWN